MAEQSPLTGHEPNNLIEIFLHEDLWDRWSRGPSFAMKMSEGPDVSETQRELCRRSQSTMSLPTEESCVKPRSECVIEELSTCCCSEDGQATGDVKNAVMFVSGGLKREIGPVKTIGSYEVGGVGKVSNVMNPDEYTIEVQCVVCRISAVEFDPRLLRESRRTEMDFMSQLEVNWKRPKQWALSSPVIPTRTYLRLCEREFERPSSYVVSQKITVFDASACVIESVSCVDSYTIVTPSRMILCN